MNEMNELVKLAVDSYHNRIEKYSAAQSAETLRNAAIELNGGSTVLDYKRIRDGKCPGLFALVEEILAQTTVEGLQEDDFFTSVVDFRNVRAGDKNLFVVNDSNLFVVDEIADGTQAIRRQRLGGATETPINTSVHAVRIYEELSRVLAGRVDFNTMIDNVSKSFRKKILDSIYTLWSGATLANLSNSVYFPVAGQYDEDALLDVIAHVEAAAGGKTATVVGTKKAIRKLAPSIVGDSAKEDLYNMGYYGKFYGSPVVALPQRHQIGSTNFMLPDDVVTIIAGDEKPIKFVYEGDSTILVGDPMSNMDLTQEYLYMEKYGMGIVVAGDNAGIGRYQFT